tara:strand:- start:159 stop:341 length:183 start_codon:yes stop_codon:yes gene_type:complete
MSVESIKQNAQSIIEAYEIYDTLISEGQPNKKKVARIKNYILKLSYNMRKSIQEERENVS